MCHSQRCRLGHRAPAFSVWTMPCTLPAVVGRLATCLLAGSEDFGNSHGSILSDDSFWLDLRMIDATLLQLY